MNKVLVTVVMVFAIAATGQQPNPPAGQTQPGTSGAPGSPASQKVIKDPAEYNAYITALNTTDPAAKAAAMEAFVKQYPQSIVLTDALEQAMAAYQQTGNSAKVEEMAKRILQLEPTHIRALAVVVALDRAKATAAPNPTALQEACSDAKNGLQQLGTWQKPEGMSDTDFAALKTQMSQIFNGALGFCALQSKDFVGARPFYQKAIQNTTNDFQDTYQLALAYLESDPIDLTGFWYGVKAINLAGNNAAAITPYFKGKYKKYHGKVDDWDQFAAAVGPQTTPPSPDEMAKLIPPAPTPCDFAVQAVQQNDISSLSFSDKEFVLSKAGCSPANKDAADKVWQNIQDTEKQGQARLKMNVKVISATNDSIEAAISDDNQAANKADMHVQLEKPITKPPAAGAMVDVVGVITKYTPDPFMFTMEQAELPGLKPPVHHTTHKKAG